MLTTGPALVALLLASLLGTAGSPPVPVGQAAGAPAAADAVGLPAVADDAAPAAADVTVERLDVVVAPTADAPAPVSPGTPAVPAAPWTPVPSPVDASVVEPTADRPVVADAQVGDRVHSDVVSTEDFQTVGLTWGPDADVAGLDPQIRYRTDDLWSTWSPLPEDDAAPDEGTADAVNAAARGGTGSFWVGDADAIQLAFAADAGEAPQDLSLALVGSSPEPAGADEARVTAAPDAAVTTTTATTTATTTTAATVLPAAVAAPTVITRAQWGAPAPTCATGSAPRLVGAVLHHTAGSNAYATTAQAMQQIRNDAAYHMKSRGWCDLGYNVIVDKWGNIYEGRAGSLTKPVIGVHAGGFNTGTLGVSMLGTYEAAPSRATQEAVARIIGWRLGSYGLDPRGSMSYTTGAGENSKYRNQTVTLPRVLGHRDVAFTACPGNGGYAALGWIRNRAAELLGPTPPPPAAASAPASSPVGVIDSITVSGSSVTAVGWAVDPDTTASIAVHMYVGGTSRAFTASTSRPDVAAALGKGDRHGFTATMPFPAGRHEVCLYAIDAEGRAPNTALGCRTVAQEESPFGVIDTVTTTSATGGDGAITATGWALDPDTTAPIAVHMYVDGDSAAFVADRSRPDLVPVFGKGDRHGFTATMPAAPGPHRVCLWAIDATGARPHTGLGCRTVTVHAAPIGHVDSVTTGPDTVTVTGWALDRDTDASIAVHVYVDGASASFVADRSRPDLVAPFGRGDRHGFTATMPATPGPHTVCVHAIDATGASPNTRLDCRTVTVPGRSPIGFVDSVTAGSGSITARGWTLDPDSTAPLSVHVYVDGASRAFTADVSRPDVAAAYGKGDRHGYTATMAAPPGLRTVCVYGIDVPGEAAHTLLGCRAVTVR